jgi:hypothetical protein
VYERKIGLQNITSNSDFECEYLTSTPNNKVCATGVKSVSSYEYWNLKKNSGGSAKVKMNWDNTKITFAPGCTATADLLVSNYTNSQWTNQGGTAIGTVSKNGLITSNSISNFGFFAIGNKKSVAMRTTGVNNTTIKEISSGKYLLEWLATNEIEGAMFKIIGADEIVLVHAEIGEELMYSAQISSSLSLEQLDITLQYFDAENNEPTFAQRVATQQTTVANNSSEELTDDILLINNFTEQGLKILNSSGNDDTYHIEIYDINGQMVLAPQDVAIGGGGEQIVPMNVGFLPHGTLIAIVSSTTRKKKKAIKVAH